MRNPNLRTVGRLAMLCAAIVPVFVGFALPFFLPGATGMALAFGLVLGGAGLLWWVERRSRAALDADTALNRSLEAGGKNLVGCD